MLLSVQGDVAYPRPLDSMHLVALILADALDSMPPGPIVGDDLAWMMRVAAGMKSSPDLRAALRSVWTLRYDLAAVAIFQTARTFVPLPAEANKTLSSAG